MGARGSRWHADGWNGRAVWSFHPDRRMNVIVAMQHELNAVLLEKRQEFRRIGQTLGVRAGAERVGE